MGFEFRAFGRMQSSRDTSGLCWRHCINRGVGPFIASTTPQRAQRIYPSNLLRSNHYRHVSFGQSSGREVITMRFILSIFTFIFLALTVSAHAPPAASTTSLASVPEAANLQHIDLLKRQAQSISLPPTFRTSIISSSSSVNSSSTVFQSSNSKPKSSSSKKGKKKKKKLKGGPLAGIIVGVIVAVIVLLVLLWFAKKSWDKRKAKKDAGYAAPVEQGGGTLADVK